MKTDLKDIKLFAFDLDGTLYIGETAVVGAVELVRFLSKDHRVVYFTNNSTKTKSQIRDKLERLQFACELDDVYTSSSATAAYLKESGINDLYVIGSPGFQSELKDQGLRIVGNGSAEGVGADGYR